MSLNKIKTPLVIFSITFMAFYIFVSKTNAGTIKEQPIRSTASGAIAPIDQAAYFANGLGNSLTGTLSNVSFEVKTNVGTSSGLVFFLECRTIENVDCGGTEVTSVNITNTRNIYNIAVTGTTSVTFDGLSTNYWFILFGPGGVADKNWTFYGSPNATSSLHTGCTDRFTSFGDYHCDDINPVKDIYFKLESTTSSHISFGLPYNNGTGYDFSHWQINVTPYGSDINKIIYIGYGQSSSSNPADWQYYEQPTILNPDNYSHTIPYTRLIQKTTPLADDNATTTWYAKAYVDFIDLNGIRYGYDWSDTITFQISPGGAINFSPVRPITYNPTQYIEQNCLRFATNSDLYKECLAAIPNATTTQTDLGDKLQGSRGIFPFNILFTILGAYKDATEANIASSSLTLKVNFPQQMIPNGSTTILSSSTLSNIIGTTNKNNLFTIETAIIWLVVATKMYLKIKTIL